MGTYTRGYFPHASLSEYKYLIFRCSVRTNNFTDRLSSRLVLFIQLVHTNMLEVFSGIIHSVRNSFDYNETRRNLRRSSSINTSFKFNLVFFGLFTFLISGCVPAIVALGAGAVGAGVAASKVKNKNKEGEPEKTQLEIREIQTRTFDTPDSKMVLKTMLNVLQDDGFIVTEGNADLGLLSATKELDVQTEGAVFWGTFFNLAWDKNAIVEATANVSEFGKQTRVRVNFQQKVYDSTGGVSTVDQITDPKFYQEFFVKVDKGLFIQKENI